MKESDLSKQSGCIGSEIRTVMIALFMVTSIGLFLAGCGTAPVENKTQPPTRRYVLKGRITKIDKPTREVLVDHEAIPGYMGAMEMPYPVADVQSLDKITVGDEIRADLVVTNGIPALENIVVTKKASAPPAPSSVK
jgi:protein SCO1